MDERKEGRIRDEYKTQQSRCIILSFPYSLLFLALSPLHPEVDEQFTNLSKK